MTNEDLTNNDVTNNDLTNTNVIKHNEQTKLKENIGNKIQSDYNKCIIKGIFQEQEIILTKFIYLILEKQKLGLLI